MRAVVAPTRNLSIRPTPLRGVGIIVGIIIVPNAGSARL